MLSQCVSQSRVSSVVLFAASLLLLTFSQAWAGPAKVDVCHIPPGNPGNFHTITISEAALPAHLEHGDFEGSCDTPCETLCDDGNACTIDACVPGTKTCINVAEREPTDCTDGVSCTNDSCDPVNGCVNTFFCCISLHKHCDPNSEVFQTVCSPEETAVTLANGEFDATSYITLVNPEIDHVILTQCGTSTTTTISANTNLCSDLPQGWNDQVCFVQIISE
jgi:hypothetical protein